MLKLLCEFVPLAAMLGLYLGGALALIGKKSYDPVGPYLFPLFMSVLAIMLMAVLILRSVRKGVLKEKMTVRRAQLIRAVLILAVSVGFLALVELAGYLLLTPFYVAAMLLILGRRGIKGVVLPAVLVTLVLYIPFRFVFNVLFPAGLLGWG